MGGYECVDNTPTPTQCRASDAPKGEGIKVGSVGNGSSWEYTANSNPGPCQWTCDEAYEKKGNECVSSSYSKCGTVVKNTWFCGEEEYGMCDDEDGTIPPTLHNIRCAK